MRQPLAQIQVENTLRNFAKSAGLRLFHAECFDDVISSHRLK